MTASHSISISHSDSDSNKVYDYFDPDDANIAIRPFCESTDLEAVQQLFRQGMRTNVPTAFRIMATAPIFLTVSSVTAILTNIVTKRILANTTFLSSLLFVPKQAPGTSIQTIPSTHNINSSILPSAIALAASLVSVGVCLSGFRRFVGTIFEQYIEGSIQDDLSRIPQVYLQGRGTFLVAVRNERSPQKEETQKEEETSSSKEIIVGCVGGQDRSLETRTNGKDDSTSMSSDDKNKPPTFELRRMSVSDKCRRLGLGRKLVTTLEERLVAATLKDASTDDDDDDDDTTSPPKSIHMFLTCSNAQPAAHRLYEGRGYQLVQKMAYTQWLYWNGFSIYRYEKTIPLESSGTK